MQVKYKYALGFAVMVTASLVFGFTMVKKEKPTETKPLTKEINSDCTFKGFKLYGKIQVVESFPDIKVQIVDAFPDIKVKVVDAFPDDCGEWQFVTSFPDVKIQFVTSFPDVKIQYVDAFPGIN